jgi:hypothetical protein
MDFKPVYCILLFETSSSPHLNPLQRRGLKLDAGRIILFKPLSFGEGFGVRPHAFK